MHLKKWRGELQLRTLTENNCAGQDAGLADLNSIKAQDKQRFTSDCFRIVAAR
jgi:hypothetical protein